MDINMTVLDAAPTATEKALLIMVYGFVEIAKQHGIILVWLACMGVFSMTNTTLKAGTPMFKFLTVLLIVTPYVFIRSVFDTKYRETFTSEYNSVYTYIKKNPTSIKKIFLWVGVYAGAILIGLIIGFVIYKDSIISMIG